MVLAGAGRRDGDRIYGDDSGNFGGGVNYWAAKHVGAKLEVRDHVPTQNDTVHY